MTKGNAQLNAEVRTLTGRRVKKLRQEGILPSTIYGHKFEPKSVQFSCRDFDKIFEEVGESGLVDLQLEGEKLPILFRNAQYDPLSGDMLHVDCYKVNLKEKIVASVPVELTGEAPAVKAGNILVQVSNEIEVEALPTDLPEKIEVDISGLENLDQTIMVADLKVGDKVEIKTALDQLIVKLEEPKEEEIVEETVAPEEVPATEQKSEEEKAEGENQESQSE